ncbi:MAG: CoA-binding protein [Chloroflexi bacterium]|nr:CoA-binding protein [Chloroflexota bacterium]
MSILVDETTHTLIQGITGQSGRRHIALMSEYHSRPVAGVTPGKGDQQIAGITIYNTVAEALQEHAIDFAAINVPPPQVRDAAFEAMANGIRKIFLYAERIPVHDVLSILEYADELGAIIIGPNSPGLCSPGKYRLGSIGGSVPYIHEVFQPGPVGVISRSGGISTTISYLLSRHGLGQSTVIGCGGDGLVGSPFDRLLQLFARDDQTQAIVLYGEVGTTYEEDAAEYISRTQYPKPIIAFIAGRKALPGFRYGHAGAIVERGVGDYTSKVQALREAGVRIANTLRNIPELVAEALAEQQEKVIQP